MQISIEPKSNSFFSWLIIVGSVVITYSRILISKDVFVMAVKNKFDKNASPQWCNNLKLIDNSLIECPDNTNEQHQLTAFNLYSISNLPDSTVSFHMCFISASHV